MNRNDFEKRSAIVAKMLFIVLVICGAFYIRYTWINEETALSKNVMVIAKTTADLLPNVNFKNFDVAVSDTSKAEYSSLKKHLSSIVQNNPDAKFAYIYCERNGKIFFIADSEPINSQNYSPPGQEYTEAKIIDKKPFIDGKELITPAVSDRWGTWISTLIPIKDVSTGKTMAVFGIDYDIAEWNKSILSHTIEAILLTVTLLLVFVFLVNTRAKNKVLSDDIRTRKQLEKQLKESEEKFKTMFNTHSAILVLIDPISSQIIDVNQSAVQFYGYSVDELKRKSLKDIISNTNNEIVNQMELASGEKESCFIFSQIISNGETRIVEVHSSPIEIESRMLLFLVIHDITERKTTEEKLQNEQLLLRTVIDNIPDSIYVKDLACRKTLVNRTELMYTGVKTEDEILGKDDFAFYPKEMAEGFFADDQFVIQTGTQVINREEYIIDAYGNKRWLLTSKIPLLDKDESIVGLVGIGHDITERKFIEEALLQSNLRFTQLSENASEWIWEIDNAGLYTYVNPIVREVIGYDPEEIIGKKYFFDFFAEKDKEELTKMAFDTFSKQEKFKDYINTNRHKDGREIILSTSGVPLYNEENKVTGYRGIDVDITKRKRDEEEIKLKNEELIKINSEKDKFFSIIAHDLRSPLNGFVNLTELMSLRTSEFTTEEISQYSKLLHNSGVNISNLLDNLLKWSMMQRGTLACRLQNLNINTLIQENIDSISTKAQQKEIEIRYSPNTSICVLADKNMTDTVLRNLLTNAVKFTYRGGKIDISVFEIDDSTVQLSINDNGVGISESNIKRLFLVNEKVSSSGTEDEPSSGLGLLLCKEFIEKQNGQIWVESEKGKGSVFSFTLQRFIQQH